MNKEIVCEIACFDYDSVRKAAAAGAHRIELCSNQPEGGVTPSIGLIEKVRRDFDIRLHVIIRPRGGNFVYLSEEIEIMKKDILACKQAGVDGVVLGILDRKNEIDILKNKEFVEIAKPMSATFHRAFDTLGDFFGSLEKVIECGFDRLLTSGGKNTAVEGLPVIAELLNRAHDRIIIMPGGGLRGDNIMHIIYRSDVKEVHSSSTSIIRDYSIPTNFCTKP